MVLPIIMAGMISFIAFGKEIFGVKLFKQIATVGIFAGVAIVSWFAYKTYKEYRDFKEDPVGTIAENLGKVREEVKYVSASSLSALLGGGTSREGYEKVREVFVKSPQTGFTPEEVGPIDAFLFKLTGVKKYELTECDKLVEGREEFMSAEDITKKRACEVAGYRKTTLKYW